jgi:hypothetical protein
MKDLSKYLPNAIDDNLKDMKWKSDWLCEPYKSHIKTAIAPILKELQEFWQKGGKETGGDGGVSEEETFSVVSKRNVDGKYGEIHEIDICRYGPADGPAVYQEWIDGEFQRTLPEFRQSEAQYKFTANAPILEELQEFRHSADNLFQSQNMYCVNISTSHRPVSYFELQQHVSPETMHQRERAKHLAHEKSVQERAHRQQRNQNKNGHRHHAIHQNTHHRH